MLAKMFSMGFDLATMPARLTWRSARAMTMSSSDYDLFMDELRQATDEATRDIQTVLADIDAEMRNKASHLNPEQKQQAAVLALDAAEKHLSMAAVDMLRALWLSVHAGRELRHDREREGVTIDQ